MVSLRKKKEKKKARRVGKLVTGLAVTGLIGLGVRQLLKPPNLS